MIDIDSCVNIISKSAAEKMNLKIEPHLQVYNTTWVDKSFHSINQHWLVPISFRVTLVVFGVIFYTETLYISS